jgi:hypothetical protein
MKYESKEIDNPSIVAQIDNTLIGDCSGYSHDKGEN